MDSQIQNKLFNYQEQPNERVWVGLADALDDQASGLSKKLYHLQEQPSAINWEKITTALDEAKEAAVVPFYKRYSHSIKKVSAVAALLVLVLAVTLFINKRTVSGEIARQPVVPASEQTGVGTTGKQNTPIQETRNSQQNSTSDLAIATHSYASAGIVKNKAQKLRPITAKPRFTASTVVSNLKRPLVNNNMLDKYIVVAAEDGQAVKLPKKIYDNVSCAKQAYAYQEACREALAKLQRKMAFQVSATDFTGLIDIIQNLQENQ